MRTAILQILLIPLMFFSSINVWAQDTLFVESGTPSLDGVIEEGEWTSEPLVTERLVTLNAMADGEFLYISATWDDSTENILKNHLTFDSMKWIKSEDEDRISFVFDMGLTGSDGANCQAFCHFPDMSTNGGIVDVWHWKAARSNPMGISEDKFWDEAGRHGDGGVSANMSNSLDAVTELPPFMASGDPGASNDYLVENADVLNSFDPFGTQVNHTVTEAVSFDNMAAFNADDFISGYVLREPSGDIASVQAAGKYENMVWTVEFKKPYAGGDHDFTVTPGGSVDFTHDIFDNQGSSHATDDTPIDPTIYTLDFSMLTSTSIDAISEELPTKFSLEQNYPNPFNPKTMIGFNIPQQGYVNLKVFNLMGQVVTTLVNEEVQPGQYQIEFDAQNLPSGIYFYTLSTDSFTETRQMTFLK